MYIYVCVYIYRYIYKLYIYIYVYIYTHRETRPAAALNRHASTTPNANTLFCHATTPSCKAALQRYVAGVEVSYTQNDEICRPNSLIYMSKSNFD